MARDERVEESVVGRTRSGVRLEEYVDALRATCPELFDGSLSVGRSLPAVLVIRGGDVCVIREAETDDDVVRR